MADTTFFLMLAAVIGVMAFLGTLIGSYTVSAVPLFRRTAQLRMRIKHAEVYTNLVAKASELTLAVVSDDPKRIYSELVDARAPFMITASKKTSEIGDDVLNLAMTYMRTFSEDFQNDTVATNIARENLEKRINDLIVASRGDLQVDRV